MKDKTRFRFCDSVCGAFCLALVCAGGASFFASFFAFEARADLKICNDTQSPTDVALGSRNETGWTSQGWWHIPSQTCASLIEGDLTSRYFYLHAEDAQTGAQWHGSVLMCVSNKEFKIAGRKDCFARGYEKAGFFEIDTKSQDEWQVRLSETDKNLTEKSEP